MLAEHPKQLESDLAAGKFAAAVYQPHTSGSGIYCETLEEAIHYKNYHEGLHLGAILALRNLI